MLNNVILVGRVVEEPKLVNLDTGYKVTNLVLAVQRPFRNERNEYEVDYIPLQAWMAMAEMICDYVGKGSILGFRCRLSTRIVEVGDVKLKSLETIVERVSFIKVVPRNEKMAKIKKNDDEDLLDGEPQDIDYVEASNEKFDTDVENTEVDVEKKKGKRVKKE